MDNIINTDDKNNNKKSGNDTKNTINNGLYKE